MLTDGDVQMPAAAPVGEAVASLEQRLPWLGGRGVDGSEDGARQPLLGYLHRGLVNDNQVGMVMRELADVAHTRGFSMRALYVEQPCGWPAAFEALIEAVIRYEIVAVALPNLLHFAALGAPTTIRDALEWSTGVRVLVAQSP
ncbi:MAG TPA: hypothetical protein VGD71_36525 [Kribbella sp.]|jgi:hypothetical protein